MKINFRYAKFLNLNRVLKIEKTSFSHKTFWQELEEVFADTADNFDFIEICTDTFESKDLDRIALIPRVKPIIISCKHVKEHGEFTGTENEQFQHLKHIANIADAVVWATSNIDTIDDNVEKWIRENGLSFILEYSASYNNSITMEELDKLYVLAQNRKADLLRVEYYPNKLEDIEVGINFLKKIRKNRGDKNYIPVALHAGGTIFKMIADLTFAQHGSVLFNCHTNYFETNYRWCYNLTIDGFNSIKSQIYPSLYNR